MRRPRRAAWGWVPAAPEPASTPPAQLVGAPMVPTKNEKEALPMVNAV